MADIESADLSAPDRDQDLEDLMEFLDDEGVGADDQLEPADVLAQLEVDEEHPEPSRRPHRHGEERHHHHRHPEGVSDARRASEEQVFKDLEAQLSAHPVEIKVSADRLTATAIRIGPEDSAETIHNELQRQAIRSGIDDKAIEAALSRASEGSPQYEVVIARGKAPVVHRQPDICMSLPSALVSLEEEDPAALAELEKVLQEGPRETVESWRGPALLVRPGQVIAEVSPAKAEVGVDVHGSELQPETDPVPELQAGSNTEITDEGTTCRADIFGYAGVVAGVPKVVPPIWVSSEAMEACFVCVSPSNNPVATKEELSETLKACWVEHGIDESSLEYISSMLTGHQELKRLTKVAVGNEPKEGTVAKLKRHFKSQELVPWRDLTTMLKLPDREALEQALEYLTEGGRTFPTVHAGDVVLEMEAPSEGTAGRDVLGEVLEPQEVEDAQLPIGENVELKDDGLRATASSFGYVVVYGAEQISVVSPLWLTADRKELYLVNLPQGEAGGGFPSVEVLQAQVEADPRLRGIDVSGWGPIRERLEAGERLGPLVTIAQGEAPERSRDASFEWAVELGGRVGTMREDGSIDLRDRRLIVVVAEGQLLGKRLPQKEGVAGKDVFGKALVPRPPTDLAVVTDDRIRSEEEDAGVTAYYAEQDGGVNHLEEVRSAKGRTRKRLRIGLSLVSEIKGDIDYSTGHVDFAGDVVIKGSVKALFKVKATGSVSISGNVEDGAQVAAGKHVEIGGGIIGSKAHLRAGGCVVAKFVQQARVRAGEDVEIAAYIFDAFVQASGGITVAGARQGSGLALVGGTIWAGRGIETPSLGSPSNPHMRLVVGIDPALRHDSEHARAKLRMCEQRISEALASIGSRQLDAALIERKVNAAQAQERERILEQARTVVEYGELQRCLGRQLDEIAIAERELASQAKLSVAGAICAGPELRIGERVLAIEQDTQSTAYRLNNEDGQVTIVADSL